MPTLSGKSRAPAVARLLEIDWAEGDLAFDSDSYERQAGAITTEAIFENLGREGQPLLVWVWDPTLEGDAADKVEKSMFGRDDFVILSKWFHCVRVPNDIVSPAVKKKLLRSDTGFLVFDGQGHLAARKGGVVKVRSLYSMLGKAFKKTFRKNAATMVKAYTDWLRELEKAEDGLAVAKAAVKALEERKAKKASASVERQLVKAQETLSEAEATLARVRTGGDELLGQVVAVASR